MKNSISVVITAFNEEEKIVDCINSVDFADEVIVVDGSSTDNTAKLAVNNGAIVLKRPNHSMLNINKNFGFKKAKNDWILSLDSDERVTPELKKEILEVVKSKSSKNGYYMPRKNIIFGKWIRHSIWWPDYQLRLFRKNKGKFPERHVHELLEIEGEADRLENPIEHLNYQTVSQFIYKLEKIYTESEAENIIRSGKRVSWHDALRMPAHDFFNTYFLQKGYKDGLHGLVLSIFQSFYMEVVFAKVWEHQGFEEKNIALDDLYCETKKLGKEWSYWQVTSKIEQSSFFIKKIGLKIKRKLVS